ncbi:hypothetical protein EMIHUDRAFT_454183 [Emiliania huxleyi CCMP1516]|uniref:ArnT-like N-terminal domain-containing protein n=2 Tax=Emiliania huxleyi TaxID=2903 RepID=A0A0D3KY93_EMIH1|nr:hypothetical protein EMIHUDRAFT_454183 [Emiliania huxleyi CCMP1516]EOD40728.1 hypothetical protein EMIHUDRAFT_454183 [Emiliania huxleyi CCMP1516]|eukprot:XP_005793157.1 hypothetical protein EMIHUDRAFT_454183 [Emiliania huxleyi CCMP1516]
MRARGKQGAASEPETDSLSDTSDTDKYAKRSDDSCSAGLSDGRALRWLLGAGVLTRFYGLAWPDEVVFDEVHFGKFITGYLTGQYFFDIHPPTGKLLIAAVAWASGFRGTQPFQKIGEAYRVGTNLFALRALPAAFGAALPPLLFSLARQLGCSSASSLLVGCLVLLDGATLGEARRGRAEEEGMEAGDAVARSQPVFYWSSTKCYADHYCRIYMAANPIVWGVGLTGLAALLLLLLGRLCSCGARRRLGTARGAPAAVRHGWLLLCGHALGWLPFAAVKRVAFLFFLPLYLGWPIEPADSRWRAKLLDPCRPVLEWVDSHVVPALFPNVSAVEQ